MPRRSPRQVSGPAPVRGPAPGFFLKVMSTFSPIHLQVVLPQPTYRVASDTPIAPLPIRVPRAPRRLPISFPRHLPVCLALLAGFPVSPTRRLFPSYSHPPSQDYGLGSIFWTLGSGRGAAQPPRVPFYVANG